MPGPCPEAKPDTPGLGVREVKEDLAEGRVSAGLVTTSHQSGEPAGKRQRV